MNVYETNHEVLLEAFFLAWHSTLAVMPPMMPGMPGMPPGMPPMPGMHGFPPGMPPGMPPFGKGFGSGPPPRGGATSLAASNCEAPWRQRAALTMGSGNVQPLCCRRRPCPPISIFSDPEYLPGVHIFNKCDMRGPGVRGSG